MISKILVGRKTSEVIENADGSSFGEGHGYSLIRRVREWERERDFYTPAIALSAYGRIEDRVRTLKAGFQMHLAKPVDPSDLAIVIENLIRS